MSVMASLLGEKPSRIVEQVDGLNHDAADSLHGAAASIRRSGQKSAKAIEGLAESTATRFDGAGSYIEEHDLKHIIRRFRHLVRRHPVGSLALAAGVGMLTCCAVLRATHVCDRTAAPVQS